MTNEELLKLAEDCGFDHMGMLNVPALEFNPAVIAGPACPAAARWRRFPKRLPNTSAASCSRPPVSWRTTSMWKP